MSKNIEGKMDISLNDLLKELRTCRKSQNNKPVKLTKEQIVFLKEMKKLNISLTTANPLWNKKWGLISRTSLTRRLKMIDEEYPLKKMKLTVG
jgi:hypothetical protein